MEAGEALGGSSHARLSLGLGFGGNRLSCALLLVLVSLVCSLVSINKHNTMRDSIFVFYPFVVADSGLSSSDVNITARSPMHCHHVDTQAYKLRRQR